MELLRRLLIIFSSFYGCFKFFIFTWNSSALIWLISEEECEEKSCIIEFLEFGIIMLIFVPSTMLLVLGSVTVKFIQFITENLFWLTLLIKFETLYSKDKVSSVFGLCHMWFCLDFIFSYNIRCASVLQVATITRLTLLRKRWILVSIDDDEMSW